jgi:hAT family C-terminal dimerisation region
VPTNISSQNRSLEEEYALFKGKLRSLTGSSDPQVFWRLNSRELPMLSLMARIVFELSPSSAISERAFSLSGIVINQRTSRIHPVRVKRYLFVNAHSDLLAET